MMTHMTPTASQGRRRAPLCDTVTGQEPSQAMLEALKHADLFVVSLATTICYMQGTKHELPQAVETTV